VLFAGAGTLGVWSAYRARRTFDGLVALFCFFVAGEEFSWGQRLFGYFPPEFFLANNFQQEANLHNLPQWFLQPKWVLMMALVGYGIVLPLAHGSSRIQHLLTRTGATAPPIALLPWFAVASVLLLIYPLPLTGEWVELLAGALFLASVELPARTLWITVSAAAIFGLGMTALVGALERGRDIDRVSCAAAETQALVDDIASSDAGSIELWQMRRVHKRIWSSVTDNYLDAGKLRGFNSVVCSGAAAGSAAVRHRYGIDPWGSPYWLLAERSRDQQTRVSVYSFGPNRRRDVAEDADQIAAGDDVHATSIARSR
jgi:hypothetical protein